MNFYKKLSKKLRRRVKKLSAILRLADGLDRSHYQNVKKLEINNTSDKINLLISTHSDPELEIKECEKSLKEIRREQKRI